MADPRRTLFVLAFGALMTSCTQDPKPAPFELVEWVQVEGSCQEDHATLAAHYGGELVHWRDKARGASMRYGSVSNADSMKDQAMLAEIQHPNRYRPPFGIEFSDIAASDFQSQDLVLHGVSVSDDPKHGAGYEATCKLIVQQRLNHLPSNKERRPGATPPAILPVGDERQP